MWGQPPSAVQAELSSAGCRKSRVGSKIASQDWRALLARTAEGGCPHVVSGTDRGREKIPLDPIVTLVPSLLENDCAGRPNWDLLRPNLYFAASQVLGSQSGRRSKMGAGHPGHRAGLLRKALAGPRWRRSPGSGRSGSDFPAAG